MQIEQDNILYFGFNMFISKEVNYHHYSKKSKSIPLEGEGDGYGFFKNNKLSNIYFTFSLVI